MIKAERGRYVAAALTIIRGFMAAGSPRNADPINGYAQYCAMIRDPLIWLSCADPCATMEEIRKQDSHLAATHQVAAQWLAAFGEQEKSAAEIVDLVNTRKHTNNDDPLVYPEFRAALSEIVERERPRREIARLLVEGGFRPNHRARYRACPGPLQFPWRPGQAYENHFVEALPRTITRNCSRAGDGG
jgi:hypothetical protein